MQRIKADLTVIGIVLAAAAICYIVFYFHSGTEPGIVEIMQNGQLLETCPLSDSKTIPILYEAGGYNLILINEGTVKVTDADCPDKLCVRQKNISRNGESIICLPHRLVIQIKSEEEGELDAVSY